MRSSQSLSEIVEVVREVEGRVMALMEELRNCESEKVFSWWSNLEEVDMHLFTAMKLLREIKEEMENDGF
jgi:hypothetical protein